jgi:hypothetical protein
LKKFVLFLLTFYTGFAYAHGPAEVYYILGWYILLSVSMLVFLIFSSVSIKTKLSGLFGLCAVSTGMWCTVGSLSLTNNSWQSVSVSIILCAAPIIGFIMGVVLLQSKLMKIGSKKT